MKDGDFTKSERNIREALFAVFYEKDWHLEYRPGEPEDQWMFVDRVIDKLRELQQVERG